MKIFKNNFIILLGAITALIFIPIKAFAFCPLCVVATGALTGFFRWIGVDDTIIGLWLGGFIFSVSSLFNIFLIKKGIKIKFQFFFILLTFYSLAVFSLQQLGGLSSYNKIFGIDKIIFGIIFGSLLLLLTPYLDKFLRKQNQGKIFISHQKMIVALGLLIIISFIFYFVI